MRSSLPTKRSALQKGRPPTYGCGCLLCQLQRRPHPYCAGKWKIFTADKNRCTKQCFGFAKIHQGATAGKEIKQWNDEAHEMMNEELVRLKLLSLKELKIKNQITLLAESILCTDSGIPWARCARCINRTNSLNGRSSFLR